MDNFGNNNNPELRQNNEEILKKQDDNNKFLNKMEVEEENTNEEKKKSKISSVPSMMKCYLCEDFCDEPMQIICCNSVFCKKHIQSAIIKNFCCPHCGQSATLDSIIENKKLKENILWFEKLLNERNRIKI